MENLNVIPFNMESKGGLKKTDWKSDIKSQLKRFQPDLIAITSTEDMWELGMHVLEEIKEFKIKNKIPVVAGGVFCTFAPDLCIRYPYVDMVCVGEGENALVDLCKKIEKGEDFSNVTNFVDIYGGSKINDDNQSLLFEDSKNSFLEITFFEYKSYSFFNFDNAVSNVNIKFS